MSEQDREITEQVLAGKLTPESKPGENPPATPPVTPPASPGISDSVLAAISSLGESLKGLPDAVANAVREATPQQSATAATPAQPNGNGEPATSATPAKPAAEQPNVPGKNKPVKSSRVANWWFGK